MKMSTKGRYGLRIMLELALQAGRGTIGVESIAASQDISASYIHVLIAGLKRAGLVRTVRGPSGGVELARPAESISSLDIVHALEGELMAVECQDSRAGCPRAPTCVARDLWCEVSQAMETVLARVTLEELASRHRAKKEESIMFHI
jgi:Rrf2 family protein